MIEKNDAAPACFTHADNSAQRLTELFVDVSQSHHNNLLPGAARRAVFRKLHGVASARLEMAASAPSELKVGVFAHDSLQAWVRFSSDAAPTDPDLRSTVGIGIKVFGVPGPKALGDDGDTADFIFQNFPIFFADDAAEMLDFTYASVVARDDLGYLAKKERMSTILDRMGKVEASLLSATCWRSCIFLTSACSVSASLDASTTGPWLARSALSDANCRLADSLGMSRPPRSCMMPPSCPRMMPAPMLIRTATPAITANAEKRLSLMPHPAQCGSRKFNRPSRAVVGSAMVFPRASLISIRSLAGGSIGVSG